MAEPRMKIGVVFPQNEIGADPAGIRAYAEGVQELGFDHILVYDHVLGADATVHTHLAGPYRTEHMFHEIFVLLGYLAAVVPGLELVTGVVIAPQRQTALLAKQAAELDVLTGGRFRLGLGLGWNDVEFEALGMNFHDRGERFEEQVELMRRLWTEPVVNFEGRWHRVTAAGLNPLPVQRPIPIWIGAFVERAVRRAVRIGDGLFVRVPGEDGWPATIERLHGWLEEAGRDPASFGIEALIDLTSGTPDDWQAAADEWRALGATHLTLGTMRGGLAGPDQHLERLREARGLL
jgi:probable F420-dependent oxidoreductase